MAISKYLDNNSIDIAKGIVTGVSHIHVLGAVPVMSQSQTGTIWDVNDVKYPWHVFDSDITKISYVAADAADSGDSLTIIGLDTNYDPLQETVTVTTTPQLTTNTFKRVFRAFSSADNAGTLTMSKNGIVVARINAGNAQTLMSVYTIPRGKTGFLTKVICTTQTGADGIGNMHERISATGAFRVGHTFEVTGAGGFYEYTFTIPERMPEKTDIDVRVTARTNNGRYTSVFDMILLDNGIA